MVLSALSLTDLKRGYHETTTGLQCNYCQVQWSPATAVNLIEAHLTLVHGGNLFQLLHTDNRYNSLTANQRDLLTGFSAGLKDQALAEQMQVAPATIRHQKFTFREKAKRARLYLAIYDSVFAPAANQPVVTASQKPKLSETETAAALQHYFDFSHQPAQLKQWPRKTAVRQVILDRIVTELPVDQHFSANTLDQQLSRIYFDPATLRRQLVATGLLKQTGTDYWRPAK